MLQEGVYFQRIRFDLTDMVVGTANKTVLERAIAEVADRFGMEWRLFYDGAVKRVAILVSRLDHCLYDILIRHRAGESLPEPSLTSGKYCRLVRALDVSCLRAVAPFIYCLRIQKNVPAAAESPNDIAAGGVPA